MKLLIIQEHVGGPWRWAICDGYIVCAVSPEPYQRPGMARRALRKFITDVSAVQGQIEFRPSIQPLLFDGGMIRNIMAEAAAGGGMNGAASIAKPRSAAGRLPCRNRKQSIHS